MGHGIRNPIQLLKLFDLCVLVVDGLLCRHQREGRKAQAPAEIVVNIYIFYLSLRKFSHINTEFSAMGRGIRNLWAVGYETHLESGP